MRHNNKIKENIDFHAKLKSATQAYAKDKTVTWSSYFGDLLFPNNPTGQEQVINTFNTSTLTSWQIALILNEIGEYAHSILTVGKVQKFEKETEVKDEVLKLTSEIGEFAGKLNDILQDEDNDFDTKEAKKSSVYTSKILINASQLHLRVEKAKHWDS